MNAGQRVTLRILDFQRDRMSVRSIRDGRI